jgi:ubiquitin-conjugating enzyme E2 J1
MSVVIKANDKIHRGALLESYKLCTKVRQDTFDIILKDDSDMNHWIMRIRDLDNEWLGGEYLAEIIAPKEFPFHPPEFIFFTPNGLYTIKNKVCIDIGTYHKDNYPATMRIGMFIYNLIGSMISYHIDKISIRGGLKVLDTSKEEKMRLASESKEFNKKYYPDYIKRFEALEHNILYQYVKNLNLPVNINNSVMRWLSLIE